MAKQPIILVSRKQVEEDIQREMGKGRSPIEAAYRVMGHAHAGLKEASKKIEAMVRKAKGFEKLTEKQMAEYDSICSATIEPETQRIGHCKLIIADWTKPK